MKEQQIIWIVKNVVYALRRREWDSFIGIGGETSISGKLFAQCRRDKWTRKEIATQFDENERAINWKLFCVNQSPSFITHAFVTKLMSEYEFQRLGSARLDRHFSTILLSLSDE